MSLSTFNSHFEVVKYLIFELGVNLDSINDRGENFMMMLNKDYPLLIRFIIEEEKDFNLEEINN